MHYDPNPRVVSDVAAPASTNPAIPAEVSTAATTNTASLPDPVQPSSYDTTASGLSNAAGPGVADGTEPCEDRETDCTKIYQGLHNDRASPGGL